VKTPYDKLFEYYKDKHCVTFV